MAWRGAAIVAGLAAVACGEGPADDDGPNPRRCAPPDHDGDGHAAIECGGDDCDDDAAVIHPGAPETPWTSARVWLGDDIGEASLGGVAFALDRAGAPTTAYAVSWGDGGELVVTQGAGALQDEQVVRATDFDGEIDLVALAVDPEGGPVLAFVERDYESNSRLFLATRGAEVWGFEGIGATSVRGLALAIDPGGTLLLATIEPDGLVLREGPQGSLGAPSVLDPDEAAAWPALAVAPDGTRHAVWRSSDRLVHAWSWAGAWHTETLWIARPSDPDASPPIGAPSLAVDSQGAVHVVWSQQGLGVLHAVRETEWRLETLDPTGTVPRVAATAGRVVVAYAIPAADDFDPAALWLARWRDDGWAQERLGTGRPRGLALEPDGTTALLASDRVLVEGARTSSLELWTDGGRGDGVDRDCDGADDPPPCATDADADGELDVACGGADCDDGDPTVRPFAVDEAGDGRDLDCDGVDGTDRDQDGDAALAHGGADCDDTDPAVHPGARDVPDDCVDADCDGLGGRDDDGDGAVARACGGHDCDDLDPASSPGAPDRAGDGTDQDCDGVDGVDLDRDGWASVDSGGEDCDARDPRVHPGADDGAMAWRIVIPDPVIEAAEDATSLALSPDGRPFIAYHATDPDRIRLVQRDLAWSGERVDGVGAGAASPSLVLDPAGAAHILYRKEDADELRHATNASGAWESETVDAVGAPGYFVSAASDAAGALFAAYVDVTERDTLQVATNASGAWVVETVDEDGASGHDVSLALDASGAVHLAYAELADEDLRYATNASGAWVVETVDDGPERGHHAALAIDAAGAAHILYREGGHDPRLPAALWYATNEDGAFALQAVDEDGGPGLDTSIALDADGFVHASEIASGAVRVVTNAAGVWEATAVANGDCSETSLRLDALGRTYVAYRYGREGALRLATDAPVADGVDQDCDGADGVDGDGDGHGSVATAGDDCDDAAPDVHPGAIDLAADGVDRDCDGVD